MQKLNKVINNIDNVEHNIIQLILKNSDNEELKQIREILNIELSYLVQKTNMFLDGEYTTSIELDLLFKGVIDIMHKLSELNKLSGNIKTFKDYTHLMDYLVFLWDLDGENMIYDKGIQYRNLDNTKLVINKIKAYFYR